MKTQKIDLVSGIPTRLNIVGNYFRLLSTTAGVDVDFLLNEAVEDSAYDMEAGFFVRQPFDGLQITSATSQQIKIALNIGDGGYDRMIGTVQISGQQGAFVHAQKSVTNANQILRAADAAAKYLLIQNNSAQILRVTLNGAAATAAKGIRIQSGGFLELSGYQASASINGFMEVADAAANNVEVVSG